MGATRPMEESDNYSHPMGKRHATYLPNMDGDRRTWRLQIDGENTIRWMTEFDGEIG